MTDRSDSELLVHLLDERDAAELDDATRDALRQRIQQAPDAAAQLETMQRVSDLLDAATTEADSPRKPGHPKLSPERRTALLAHHRAWAERKAAPEATPGASESAPRLRILAFGPHVERALLQQGRDAGADEVLPRGAFDRQLPDILVALAGRTGTSG